MSLVELGPAGHQNGLDSHFDRHGNEYHWLPIISDAAAADGLIGISPSAAAPTLADTFRLHSKPGAAHTIYLDFDGHVTSGTYWNSSFNGGQPIDTPAYSFSGDASFTDSELTRIQAIWQRVAEDFVPFNVNVTTEEPALSALTKSNGNDSAWGVRIVIGGSGSWFGSGGGVAYVGSFNWSGDTPAFVFENNLGNGNEKYTAEAISHEAGHTLGLNHDGRTSPSEEYFAGYGSGVTSWAPIMGNSYYKSLTQWSRGEYGSANNSEDDLSIITTQNGFGYRTDDHGNTRQSATAISASQGVVAAGGIIERNTDYDYFGFATDGGALNLDFLPFERSPNLDIGAALYDAAGVLLASSNPVGTLSAAISATLTAGQYFVSVTGVGEGNPQSGGYSDYGSLGSYTLSGTIAGGVVGQVFANNDSRTVSEDAATTRLDVLANDTHETGGSLVISSVGTASSGGTLSIFDGSAVDYRPAANFFGQETFTYTITDGVPGNEDTATVTVTVTPVNDAPTAQDDAFSVAMNSTQTLDVLANDTILPDSGETLSISSVSAGSAGGAVVVLAGQSIQYTPATGFMGQETFTYTVNDGTPGSSDTATVTVTVRDSSATINFNDYTVGPYAGTQDVGVAVVEDGGATLHLSGNAWKQIAYPYQVTAETILEFDFRSPAQGEIHSIGFDTDLGQSIQYSFKLYGTQAWSDPTFNTYASSAPDLKHFVIPVGQFYTGSFSYLFFGNDHDVANPSAQGYFSNVRVYEDGAEPPVNNPPVAGDDSFVVDEDSATTTLNVLANDTADPGETLTITSTGAGSNGGTITILGGASITYAPAADFFGTETFTYTINDGTQGNSDSGTVTVTVNSQADAVADSVTTPEDTSVTVNVLANDGFSGSPQVTSVTQGASGSVVLNADGTATYTPNPGFVGQDGFSYTANSAGNTETALVTVTVSPTAVPLSTINFNDYTVGPYAGTQDVGVAVVEDGGATLHLSGNAWKQIAFPYQVTADTILEFDFRSPSQGEIHGIGFDDDLGASIQYSFKLYGTQGWSNPTFNTYASSAPDWMHFVIPVGQYYTGSFNYMFFSNDHDVANPNAEGFFSNVQVYEDGAIPPASNPPIAGDDSFVVDEDSATTTLNVLANDSADPGETLAITSTGAGSKGGTITIVGGTSIAYTPAPDFFGTETFTYTINDGTPGSSDSAVVTVTVNSLADAVADSATTPEDTSVTINVLANDGFSGSPQVTSVTQGASGSVAINVGGTVTYTPNAGFVGQDSFNYTATSGGTNESATVSVVVEQAGQGPSLNFNDFAAGPYGGIQDRGIAVVEDDGATLHISGNAWKQIAFSYQVTANTMLEFDFRSPSQGEIHSIGFDNDLEASIQYSFKLYGTQGWSNPTFNTYASSAPNWKHFVIQVGQFYTGSFNYLFFANDHDVANPSAEGFFSNVRVYEATSGALAVQLQEHLPTASSLRVEDLPQGASEPGAAPVDLFMHVERASSPDQYFTKLGSAASTHSRDRDFTAMNMLLDELDCLIESVLEAKDTRI